MKNGKLYNKKMGVLPENVPMVYTTSMHHVSQKINDLAAEAVFEKKRIEEGYAGKRLTTTISDTIFPSDLRDGMITEVSVRSSVPVGVNFLEGMVIINGWLVPLKMTFFRRGKSDRFTAATKYPFVLCALNYDTELLLQIIVDRAHTFEYDYVAFGAEKLVEVMQWMRLQKKKWWHITQQDGGIYF